MFVFHNEYTFFFVIWKAQDWKQNTISPTGPVVARTEPMLSGLAELTNVLPEDRVEFRDGLTQDSAWVPRLTIPNT